MGKLTKVLKFVDDSCEVFPNQLPHADFEQAKKSLSIITSIGSFGIGKSFLQNVLLGAIEKGQSFFEDETEFCEVFPLETSVRAETKGIDMFTEYLPSPHTDKDLVLSLWDTEGLSNPNQPRHHDISIFRLSAYFSQVLIYNVKEMISSESMDKMQVFLEDMRTGGKTQETKFQTLIIVVRDAHQQFGYCWEGGEAYLNHIKSQGKPGKQTDVFFRELNDKFRSVLVFMMPPPNQKVKRKSTKITHMRDIEDQPFRDSLRSFTQKLLYEIVQPGIVGGEVFRVCDLKPQLTMFAKKFQSREQPTRFTLANAIKEQHMAKESNSCFQTYQRKLLESRGWFQTEATRTKRNMELRQSALDTVRASTEGHYMEVRFINAAIAKLDKRLDERFKVYNDKAKKVQNILWITVGIIFGAGAVAFRYL